LISVTACGLLLAATVRAHPQPAREYSQKPSLTILYDFRGQTDGQAPSGALIADSSGSLYGETESGGGVMSCNDTCGTVFKLTKHRSQSGPSYSESILYSFRGGSDGMYPTGGLIADAKGALYGVTNSGGALCGGCGTVFKLTPTSLGYVHSVVYAFRGGSDGAVPQAGVVMDASGTLYGTTIYGGGTPCDSGAGCGTVFKLTPTKTGYRESVIHRFQFNDQDGFWPLAPLIVDSTGALYGTTLKGGKAMPCLADGCGTVFKLTPHRSGYVESIMYSFQERPDGSGPEGGILLENGVLYGTTAYGGSSSNCGAPNWEGCGTVFRLAPAKSGYVESVLYNFQANKDGELPGTALIPGHDGSLIGTTFWGGCGGTGNECGTAFKLTPGQSGYTEQILHVFTRDAGDGGEPAGTLLREGDALYGSTVLGGGYCSCGTVFKLRP